MCVNGNKYVYGPIYKNYDNLYVILKTPLKVKIIPALYILLSIHIQGVRKFLTKPKEHKNNVLFCKIYNSNLIIN